MNMLVFDPIRAMSHDFLRVSQYFTIPPKLYKRSEAVVRLEAGELEKQTEEEQHQNKKLDKSHARRGGTLIRKLSQLRTFTVLMFVILLLCY